MKNTFAVAAASAFMLLQQAYAEDAPKTDAPATDGKDYVMIKVNGDDIKKSEVDEAWKTVFQGHDAPPLESMDSKVKDKFLREVATEHMLFNEAQKEGIDKSPEVVSMMEKIRHQVEIQQLLKNKTESSVTDDKLKAEYAAHLEASKGKDAQEELNARHILVKTKEEADAIEKKLKSGTDFAKLAKEKSQDKTSGAAGGELGWFTPDKMLPAFSDAALKLKKNEISPPVKTDFGWHVIQLEGRRKATPPTFDEVKETLKQEVGTKYVSEYVKSLMADAKIAKLDSEGHETPLPADVPAAASPAAGKSEKDDKEGAE